MSSKVKVLPVGECPGEYDEEDGGESHHQGVLGKDLERENNVVSFVIFVSVLLYSLQI